MATSPINNIKASVAPNGLGADLSAFVDNTVSFNQGDLIAIVSNKLKAIAADSDTSGLVGVATCTVVSGKLKSPYTTDVDASVGKSAVSSPQWGVVAELKLNVGDSFTPGALVYPIGTVDAQTVSTSSNSGARKACGIFIGAAVTGASGVKGLVRLGNQLSGELDL